MKPALRAAPSRFYIQPKLPLDPESLTFYHNRTAPGTEEDLKSFLLLSITLILSSLSALFLLETGVK